MLVWETAATLHALVSGSQVNEIILFSFFLSFFSFHIQAQVDVSLELMCESLSVICDSATDCVCLHRPVAVDHTGHIMSTHGRMVSADVP